MKVSSKILAAALACALLFSGCSSPNRPVSAPEATPSAKTAKPTKTPKPLLTPQPTDTAATVSPTSTPQPSAEPPDAYSFPMGAAGLFGPDAAPDGFSCPVWLSGDGRMFLYVTTDDRIFRADWDGSSYVITPVAENIAAGVPMNAFVDGQAGTLFCQGSRAYSGSSPGPCIVLADLADGARCNLDDYVGWKESGFLLSPAFQYFGGLILSEVEQDRDGKYASSGKWAVVDLNRRAYTVLDLTGFLQKNLPQWQDLTAMKLALVGENRLLAVCRVRGAIPTATGQTVDKEAEAYCAFLLDMNGNVLTSATLTPDAGGQDGPALLSGVCVSASADGKYLLYGSTASPGVFLFDVDRFKETMIPGSAGSGMAFAQWGSDGAIYYGLSGQANGRQVTIYKTTVAEAAAQ